MKFKFWTAPVHIIRRKFCQLKKLLVEGQYQETITGTLPITTVIDIVDATTQDKWPVFRLLDNDGRPLEGANLPKLSMEEAQRMYSTMIRISTMDDVFYNAQRQGRISFYMQNSGEEATHIGSAAALKMEGSFLSFDMHLF